MYNNINLVQGTIEEKRRPKKKRTFLQKLVRSLLFILIAYFIISFFLSSKIIFSQETLGAAISKLPVISQLRSILGANDVLSGKDENRLNLLIMGIGGTGHEGALLTDTMMLASVDLSTNQASLISIPRDLLVKIPNNGWQRINHASAYGDLNNYPGGGSALAAKTVEDTFGVPIDYYLRLDFSGFTSMIDDLGGIDVSVDRFFVDNQYPTEDYKVMTISFNQGIEHMDGQRALQFARSRHGDNGEGSDFARAKRQQKILFAVKDKILNWKTLANPNRVYNIYNNITKNIQTNIKPGQLSELMNLAKTIDFGAMEHYVIDDSPGGLLKSIITDDGAQILAPKSGDFEELRDFVKNIFVVKEIINQHVSVVIANGTTIEGLATFAGADLSSWGFTVERLINSPEQDFEKTVIYDLTGNQENALKILKKRLAANTAGELPEFLKPLLYRTNDQGEQEQVATDFLIVVGLDQQRSINALEEWQQEQAKLQVEPANNNN